MPDERHVLTFFSYVHSVSCGQKSVPHGTIKYGYSLGVNGSAPTPITGLVTAFDVVDAAIGEIVTALTLAGIFDSTTSSLPPSTDRPPSTLPR